MAIKDVLVHVDGSNAAPARLAAAIDLAQLHGAHLIGLCLAVEPRVPSTILGMIPPDLMTERRNAVLEQAETAVAQFRVAVEAAGLPGEGRIVQVLDIDAAETFIQHARHADLAILSQPDPQELPVLGSQFATSILIGSGRPTLLIPYIGPAATLGQRVLVAWDGGREATRALHDALPLLTRARSVTVLSVNPDVSSNGGRREPGADISLHLARHGASVTADRTVTGEVSAGDAILADVADNGIDLLVMGAYGHSRLRDFVLGGVTRYMLEHMTVPVLMSH
jgi:nucleotide-binding universal stress UspA family protein